jgi:hypothetical protein
MVREISPGVDWRVLMAYTAYRLLSLNDVTFEVNGDKR